MWDFQNNPRYQKVPALLKHVRVVLVVRNARTGRLDGLLVPARKPGEILKLLQQRTELGWDDGPALPANDFRESWAGQRLLKKEMLIHTSANWDACKQVLAKNFIN